jgi:hypothetical protein
MDGQHGIELPLAALKEPRTPEYIVKRWARMGGNLPFIKDKKSKWGAQGVDKPKQKLKKGSRVFNIAAYLRGKR